MRWYLNRAGTAEGPFEEAALVTMVRGGQVPPNAQICPEGGNAWVALASHPPFAQPSQPALPAAPSPGVAATMALDSAALGEALKQHGMSMPGTASAAPGGPPHGAPTGGFAQPSAYGSPGAQQSQGGFAQSSAYGSQPGVQQPGGFAQSSAYGSQPGVQQPQGGFAQSSAYGSQPGTQAPGGWAQSSAHGSQPGVAQAPHGFAPPSGPGFGPAGSAPKKNNLPLMIGGGCALLMVLSMCVFFGVFVIARM